MKDKGIVLLVEDNEELNIANSRALKLRGHTVVTAKSLAEGKKQLDLQEPDIILLDIMLPDGNGMDFCAEIRKKTSAHILFLTAKTEHENIIQGLDNGGDDYITKPFHPEELLARIDSVMRRRRLEQVQRETLKKDGLVIDMIARQVFFEGNDLLLTPKEFSLLVFLSQNEGQVMNVQQIYEKVWNISFSADKNAVQAAISKLRQKIEPHGLYIDSIRGKGYIFRKN